MEINDDILADGILTLEQPLAQPLGSKTIGRFWLNRVSEIGEDESGFHLFRFVGTRSFPNGSELQFWQGWNGLYCTRIGRREYLRFCGDIDIEAVCYSDVFPECDEWPV
ncbi:hypothetical protein [Sinorhizobium fredii]|uniref:Uncharacterized protein n=1 Tax=Rhizobium fredii TaxID=380 RepID=A0A844AAW2_RHIFR|nr:hypothetical protein [Sinorhizobium fredii]MQX09212.1 hypothetical protein [Sinorhizobium fredii]GEC30658.1 hypothetical protein EFR01_08290 [Sinorhizobium fredii]GLS06593.1 hypothetical protein GCM10007864_02180 [Sinorhizobium fredii]